ncbi:SLATT domain-containing protein [Spirillospora sp. NPDC047279]|uniref:SLATT domain-containing protein n=1 Tax=Spirillospora sp. NPDC047279 TaxID=3155478 RepID=UPI00340BA1EB
MQSEQERKPYTDELGKLCEDSSYSAQAYFEAAKSAEFWDKIIVFVPSLVAAVAALLVAVGEPRAWAALGAVSGAVAATASFVGTGKRAASYKETGRRFTKLRHDAALELSLVLKRSGDSELERKVRSLRKEYAEIVSSSDLVSNRLFKRAAKRVKAGVLSSD